MALKPIGICKAFGWQPMHYLLEQLSNQEYVGRVAAPFFVRNA